MIRELSWKPDFGRTVDRFEAWWRCEVIDRPPVTLRMRPTRPWRGPPEHTGSWRERWLDAEYQVERAEAVLVQRDFVGDELPIVMPDVGPELAGALLGCELCFAERTSWSAPILHAIGDWDAVVSRPLDFDNPCWRAVERMTHLALERSEGRYLVGVTDLHMAWDTMAALRDPQGLCLDIADDPDRMRGVGRAMRRAFLEAFDRLWGPIRDADMGCTTWAPLYHEGPAYLPSCDFWCMVGPETARDLILPDLRAEMAPLERTLFHLDGPQALRHLDLLLELPELDAVQWVYGAGHGPARAWLDVYRRIREAGKAVQVIAGADDGLAIIDELGPEGIWLTITEPFDDRAAAEGYLAEVERRSVAPRRMPLASGGRVASA